MNDKLGSEDVLWDLTHLYKDQDDEAIGTDIDSIKERVTEFSTQYKGNLNSISPNELFKAVTEMENIYQKSVRISTFAYLNFTTRTDDARAGAFLQKVQEIFAWVQKEILFFDLEWASLQDAKVRTLLDDPLIRKYRHYLEKLRKYRPHQLTEIEERLLAELSPTGTSSWNKLFEKVLSQMRFGKAGRAEEEVLSDLYDPDREIRKQASHDLTGGLSSQLHILTHIFNTILADKMIMDRLRKYPEWISSMNLDNELDETIVMALVDAVTARYDIPRRYYRLKKTLLGYDELFDYDRYAPLPASPERTIPWNEAREIVLQAYHDFSPEMNDIAKKFFDGNWIHAPVMPGKRGGAFSDPCTPDVHPYLMLNYMGDRRDVETMGHELGHGIHQYLAGRQQGFLNSHTPIPMAETASVFGEMLVFCSLMDKAKTKDEKLRLLTHKLEQIFATVFRQVAMNRFEDVIHNERRDAGELSSERFGELWIHTQKEMFGDTVTLTGNYTVWWSYIPHFLEAPGYVYAYAFGELLVLSLYKRFKEEREEFVPKYLELLAAGGKDTPVRLLEGFGIRLDDPGFWQDGLDIINGMLEQAEELVQGP